MNIEVKFEKSCGSLKISKQPQLLNIQIIRAPPYSYTLRAILNSRDILNTYRRHKKKTRDTVTVVPTPIYNTRSIT